jgi:hypothetical protein
VYVEMVTMTVRPEDVEAFLAGRTTAMAAIQERYPDLRRARLVRLDQHRWVDWVEWESLEQAQTAAQDAPAIGPVAAWFGLIESVESMQHGEVVHRFGHDQAATVAVGE